MDMRFNIIILFLLISVVTFANGIVQHIVVTPNNQTVSNIVYDEFSGLIGKRYNRSKVQKSIFNLYKLGVFEKITPIINYIDQNIELSIEVEETPVIQSIVFDTQIDSLYLVIPFLKNRIGRQLNYHYLNDDLNFINNYLTSKGYSYASVKLIHMLNGELKIVIEDPTLNDIHFIGLKKVKPFVLYRELMSDYDHSLNQLFLDKDYDSLKSLPYFSFVSTPIVNYISSDNVTIAYQVIEKDINRLDFGIEELENDEGVALFSRVLYHHSLIYSDRWLIQAQLGYMDSWDIRSYLLHYQQPWLWNKYNIRWDLKYYTIYRTESYQSDRSTYYTTRHGLSSFFTRPIKNHNIETGIGFTVEEVTPREDSVFSSYDLSYLSYFFSYNNLSNPMNPKNGLKSVFTIEKGGELLDIDFGGINYFRFFSTFSHYIPILEQSVFAYRLFAGYYNKEDDIATFETEQFSLGGSNSLRGYKELSFYGDYRLSFNIEPRFQLSEQLVGVLFMDIGFISDDLNDEFLLDPKVGYGVGVRFHNFLLPLRFDLAYGEDLILHFNVSNTF